MIDINKINSKLKYTEFYNMPNENWNDWSFYMLLDDHLVNNYNFLNTFKDKINFSILYRTKKVKLKFIKCFMDKYGGKEWYMILSKQNITPQFLNKHYRYINYTFEKGFDLTLNCLNGIIYAKLCNIAHKLKPEVWADLQSKFKI